jgi:Lrp/AsnC family transcriptional regulator for asnA, asnC and gidA
MEKIDLKDRKILYELDLDARQSLTHIGKKVGFKKDVVSYRIKRLQDEGIITSFWTAINTYKLGYNVFRIYINFQYVGSDKKNEIIDHFVNYKNAWVVASLRGPIDFDAVIWVNDIYEFYNFWNNTLDKYEEFFSKYTFSIYIESFDYKKDYLFPENKDFSNRELYRTSCVGKPVKIDELDYRLLNEIVMNARMPLIDLAKKLNCSSQTIHYRLNNLIKLHVIDAFRVNIDVSKLGLQLYKVDIYLKDHKQRNKIIEYLKTKPYLIILNVAIGWSDIEPEFIFKNIEELSEEMEHINSKFPNVIKNYDYWLTAKEHKFRWLPEMEF